MLLVSQLTTQIYIIHVTEDKILTQCETSEGVLAHWGTLYPQQLTYNVLDTAVIAIYVHVSAIW